ncbi:MAG: EAL domain-containing protein [Rhizobiaceae bacterium]
MSAVKQVGKWLKRLFILACMLALCFSAVIYLSRNDLMSTGQSLTIGLIIIFAIIIIHRQRMISRDIRNMKSQSAALIHYEDDIKRRLEALTLRVNGLADNSNPNGLGQVGEDGTIAPMFQADHSEAIAILNSRINSLQDDSNPSMDRIRPDVYPLDDPQSNEEDLAAPTRGKKSGKKRKIELNEKSLNMHLQPIIELPSRRPAYFDAFMRLNSADGEFVDQSEFRKLAEAAGLMPTIDKKIVFSAVRMVRKLNLLKKKAGVFCPISPVSLGNAHNFREIFSFLQANASLRGSLVIEITQRELAGLSQDQHNRLSNLSDMDIALSLNNVQDLNLDAEHLARCGFKFVKVPASILLHANLQDNQKGIEPESLAEILEVEGIRLIATEVERDRDAVNLIDMELPLAQGLLFAPPRPVKAELLINAEPEKSEQLQSTA